MSNEHRKVEHHQVNNRLYTEISANKEDQQLRKKASRREIKYAQNLDRSHHGT